MILWKKAAVSLAAMSMVLAPVAASAAPASRAVSVAEGENALEGASWLPMLLAIAIIAGGVWLVVDGDNDDEPASP
jgi:hypothetical protein